MPLWGGLKGLAALATATVVTTGCAVQLVSPYNSDLQQRASAMQAEVGTWDLAMRAAAGSVRADPRNPAVAEPLNKWRGQADAMLTLAISSDPGLVKCGDAIKAIHHAIVDALPADVSRQEIDAAAGGGSATQAVGCESVLVSRLGDEIDQIRTALAAGCKLSWVDDAYFATIAQNTANAPKPPVAPRKADQDAVTGSCSFEFNALSQAPPNAAAAGHGVAVSRLLRTLQAIVYIETRKKAAAATK